MFGSCWVGAVSVSSPIALPVFPCQNGALWLPSAPEICTKRVFKKQLQSRFFSSKRWRQLYREDSEVNLHLQTVFQLWRILLYL